MANDLRDLLYLSVAERRQVELEALRAMLGMRWRLRPLSRAGAAALPWDPTQQQVGLLDLRQCRDVDELAGLEAPLSRGTWIAAIETEQLEDDWLRAFIRSHCYDYVSLPCPERLLRTVVGHAWGLASLAPGSIGTHGAPAARGMIGDSAPMQALYRAIGKAARSDAPVMIQGESGTGKELAARAIHAQSSRADQPFVAINCGAIPEHLVLSELFGYERGAFTGAQQRKMGRIELAHRGTLFLDEVGDLPLDSQASLLRFLQEGQVERLGGHDCISVDARIVSATHVDLAARVAEGRFRLDLFHRLCVVNLGQPPLRARGDDIMRLALHALDRYRGESRRALRGFTPAALRALRAYAWPGNVRELNNRIRQAIVLAEGAWLTAEDLRLGAPPDTAPQTLEEVRDAATRQAVERALCHNNGRLAEAARELGISRVTLYRLMTRLGLQHGLGGDQAGVVA
jgi:DNA-binding NtrC family response regulator